MSYTVRELIQALVADGIDGEMETNATEIKLNKGKFKCVSIQFEDDGRDAEISKLEDEVCKLEHKLENMENDCDDLEEENYKLKQQIAAIKAAAS